MGYRRAAGSARAAAPGAPARAPSGRRYATAPTTGYASPAGCGDATPSARRHAAAPGAPARAACGPAPS